METPNVIAWIEATVKMYEEFKERNPHMMGGAPTEAWLLEHGRPMGPRIPLPEGVEYGKAKMCFTNAFNLAFDNDEFTYAEGFAYTPGLMAVHHAWVLDAKGNVIDPTWRDGGNECPFCDGGSEQIRECMEHTGLDLDECFCDETDEDFQGYYETERECRFCEGSGKSKHEHPSREGGEYFGVTVDRERLVRFLLDKGTYGVLPDCIPELEKEAA